jgi:hypothetical protein
MVMSQNAGKITFSLTWHSDGAVVDALRYKPEGRGIDS